MAVETHFDQFSPPNSSQSQKKIIPVVYVTLRPDQGGIEARDFCNIFLKIIEKYCLDNKIKYELISETDYEISLRLEDEKTNWQWLHGYHKLVRVSPFGQANKIHTSLCKINISVPDKKIKMVIDEKDLKIDFFKSPGPGGQNKNKSMSAVRLTHLPTKTVVVSCSQRSQLDNKEKAIEQLKEKLSAQEALLVEMQQNDKRRNNLSQKQIVLNFYFNHKLVTNEICGKKTTLIKNVLNGDLNLIK